MNLQVNNDKCVVPIYNKLVTILRQFQAKKVHHVMLYRNY